MGIQTTTAPFSLTDGAVTEVKLTKDTLRKVIVVDFFDGVITTKFTSTIV